MVTNEGFFGLGEFCSAISIVWFDPHTTSDKQNWNGDGDGDGGDDGCGNADGDGGDGDG